LSHVRRVSATREQKQEKQRKEKEKNEKVDGEELLLTGNSRWSTGENVDVLCKRENVRER
jgi:hypothetical protein